MSFRKKLKFYYNFYSEIIAILSSGEKMTPGIMMTEITILELDNIRCNEIDLEICWDLTKFQQPLQCGSLKGGLQGASGL